MTDLHYMSATEALRAFRARTLSPVELMAAFQKKSGRRLRLVGLVAGAFDVGFGHGAPEDQGKRRVP